MAENSKTTSEGIIVTSINGKEVLSFSDDIFGSLIPGIGQIDAGLAWFWASMCHEIAPSTFSGHPDPNIILKKSAKRIPYVFKVFGYAEGKFWNIYETGKRIIQGNKLNVGIEHGAKLDYPFLLIMTEDGEIADREKIIQELSSDTLERLETMSLNIFELGSTFLETKNLVLTDAEYVFSNDGNKLRVSWPFHTFRNSNICLRCNPENEADDSHDKFFDPKEPALDQSVIEAYQAITGEKFTLIVESIEDRTRKVIKHLN